MQEQTKIDLIKSGIHAAETFVVGGAVLTVVYMFRDDAQVAAAIKDALLNIIPVALAAGVAKLNRESGKTPTSDYVNDIK